MKPPRESNEFLHDVVAGGPDDDFRAASLHQGLMAVRRQRQRRRALNVTVAIIVGAVLAIWSRSGSPRESKPSGKPRPDLVATDSNPRHQTVPGTQIHIMSDEELLALFPGRPVALVGPPNRCELVLLDEPRPAARTGGADKKLHL